MLDDPSGFDAAWRWLGSYATWRAAMRVYLYPENALRPTLRRERTLACDVSAAVAALRESEEEN